MDFRYVTWAFRRSWNWSLLVYAIVMTEAVFHKGINLPGLFGTAALGWAALFVIYLADRRTRAKYWKSKSFLSTSVENDARL